jgi:putative ABC transport system ATP-binding protein
VQALRGVDLSIAKGERVAVLGRSGSGKSTLLNILGLLDEATSGTYLLNGKDVAGLSGTARDRFRAGALGFVFQESHVLGHRSVEENIWLGLMAGGVPRVQRAELIGSVLERVGLSHRVGAPARLLSGGERQRLAVARAVATTPRVLLADEPTGNLDGDNAGVVLGLFDEQAEQGVTVVVITHDPRTAAWADRIVQLVDGRIESSAAGHRSSESRLHARGAVSGVSATEGTG